MTTESKSLRIEIPQSCAGMRLDRALVEVFPGHSRSTLQKWLQQGLVVVDEELPRQRDRVSGGEWLEVSVPEATALTWVPQRVAVDILYQDDHILVLNKPAGLVVHPGAGNVDGTLVNGLLHHAPELARLPRAGIVHRLDKDTTGLMVVARTEAARLSLIDQLARRRVRRVYLAVVHGRVISGGSVDAAIARDRNDRRRMRINSGGKSAITHFRVGHRYRAHTLVECRLESGRTHQIRVHMRHRGFPVVGDPVYGGRLQIPPQASPELIEMLRGFKRQALHATALSFVHPDRGEVTQWSQPLPVDMRDLCAVLEDDAVAAEGRT